MKLGCKNVSSTVTCHSVQSISRCRECQVLCLCVNFLIMNHMVYYCPEETNNALNGQLCMCHCTFDICLVLLCFRQLANTLSLMTVVQGLQQETWTWVFCNMCSPLTRAACPPTAGLSWPLSHASTEVRLITLFLSREKKPHGVICNLLIICWLTRTYSKTFQHDSAQLTYFTGDHFECSMLPSIQLSVWVLIHQHSVWWFLPKIW